MSNTWKGEDLIRTATPNPKAITAKLTSVTRIATAMEAVSVAKIRADAAAGLTKAECARHIKLDYQRVCTLARKHGIIFENGNTLRRWDRIA